MTEEKYTSIYVSLSRSEYVALVASAEEAGLNPRELARRLIRNQLVTVIQKIENQWQNAETTDKLDDPIRR